MIRLEDYRGSCDRIGEEPARRHHLDAVLTVRFRPAGPADLHGRVDAKMHPLLPQRWIIRQFDRRQLRGLCFKFL